MRKINSATPQRNSGEIERHASDNNIIELFPGRERSDIELAEINARHLLDERDAEIASIRAGI